MFFVNIYKCTESLGRMLSETHREVFGALNFYWEPGRDVRNRLENFGIHLSGTEFGENMTHLKTEGIANRRMVLSDGSDNVLYVKRCIDGNPSTQW
jgi:hypothetical protein